jgi:ribosomal protein S18 acetylase RimI-like enzyme
MTTIEIAQKKHLPQILALWQELMDYHAQFDPLFETRQDGAKNWEQYLRGMMQMREARVFIAIEEGQVIGYSPCRVASHPPVIKQGHYGLIMDMAVKQGHQRRGVGTMMLEAICDWVQSMGLDRIELQVVPDNNLGYSFWKKHGFADYLHSLYKKI